MSKERFAAYFGKYSSHEDVQLLYRVLSQQIQEGMEEVKANISAEAQQGVKQQRQVVKARRKEHQTIIDAFELQDIQMTMEVKNSFILVLYSFTDFPSYVTASQPNLLFPRRTVRALSWSH